MKHKLEVDSITLEFGLRQILTDVYLKCETGSISGLLGRNGEGKTCLMNIIYGSLKTSNKSIRFDNITVTNPFKRPDLLTFLPQYNFLPGFLSLQRIFSDFDISFIDFINYFPEFGEIEKTKIKNLSTGDRRLIEVYVIIKTKSQFSILDEPFSHLTPLQIQKVTEILVSNKSNKGFLITDHLYEQILATGDQVYVLANGKIHLSNSVAEIRNLGYLR
jgi:lipopolysaccharide export system ATP-binding protein